MTWLGLANHGLSRFFFPLPTATDPFADATKGDDLLPAGTEDYIHIRIQQRNGRKTLTTVQGIADDYDKKKLVKAFKKVKRGWLLRQDGNSPAAAPLPRWTPVHTGDDTVEPRKATSFSFIHFIHICLQVSHLKKSLSQAHRE